MTVLDVSANRIDDGFFVLHRSESVSYEWPSDVGDGMRFVGSYQNSGSPIREALVAMIRGARRRVFVASFMIGDEVVLTELIRTAERLRGGVYVITALDEKSLRRGLAEYEDQEQEAPEERRKNFQRLTTNGVYVRGHESCHAKFAVADDTTALVGSANFVSKGFEWTGEANVIIQDAVQVRQLARLFTSLWFDGCRWEVPPGETYCVAKRHPTAPPRQPERPDVRSPGVVWTNGAEEMYLHQCICDLIAGAQRQITLASYSVTGMTEKSHLLLQPLREAIGRGVAVQLFVRQQNPNKSQRADLRSLHDMGVEIFGDLRNHAKGIIVDGVRGALFSCNFDGQHGLDSGVEVGVRLDGDSSLKELERYLRHAMQYGNARYVRNPTLAELNGTLAAKWCKPWPCKEGISIRCPRETVERFVAHAKAGPVLFERQDGHLNLFAGRGNLVLQLTGDSEAMSARFDDCDHDATDRLESWLLSVRRGNTDGQAAERGFCAAKLAFTA